MWGNFGDGDGASSLSQGRKGLLGVQGSNALSLMLCKHSLLMMPPYKPQYLIVREMKGCFSVEECGVGQKLGYVICSLVFMVNLKAGNLELPS
jgi:hypothetical protein